ncbi:tyrosine-type recombinase/integrase [Schaalia sp. ZJ405]|uniref:tyrosine-type recombinase/integrase n=1 Tax=Schaalia sp. ZJ405 TaxID=2709403 RepID=UPI0013ED504C|nr:tyrosine-type recombinase/integrase [Schaalia sp. ZJ405]QPK80832.1 tyrosine-type recombinase/integrase [Schaalia sp. ZJ405]
MVAAKLPRGIVEYRGMYRVRISIDGKRHLVGDYPVLKDAKAALDIARAQKITGQFVTAEQRRAEKRAREDAEKLEQEKNLTVKAWAQEWLAQVEREVEQGLKSRGTLREYKGQINNSVIPYIGDKLLVDVTEDDIKAIMRRARETSSAKEAKTLIVIRRMFNVAVEQNKGGLITSPVRYKETAPETSATRRAQLATPEQVKSLAEAMPPLLQLTVYLGMWVEARQGEVLGLQRGDFVDLDKPGRATVRIVRQWNQKEQPPRLTPTKAKDTRTLSIPEALVPLIKAHLDEFVGEGEDAFVFPSPLQEGKPVSQSAHNRYWNRAKKNVGMPRAFRFHDLRASGLTIFAQQGATVAEIMARGGHKDVSVAMRYQRAAAERDRELAAKMPVVV